MGKELTGSGPGDAGYRGAEEGVEDGSHSVGLQSTPLTPLCVRRNCHASRHIHHLIGTSQAHEITGA